MNKPKEWVFEVVSGYIRRTYKKYPKQTLLALLVLDINIVNRHYNDQIKYSEDLFSEFVEFLEKNITLSKDEVQDFCQWLADTMWERYGQK